MRKKSILKILTTCLIFVLLLSFAACDFGKKKSGEKNNTNDPTVVNDPTSSEVGNDLKSSDIKKLANLTDYSKSTADYNPSGKTFDEARSTYDGKDCSAQIDKLQNRIDKKTEDVWVGKTESAATKIFTKSTPAGILTAIAKASLTFDEMVRTVDYIAGEEDADVDSFVKEGANSWSGSLTLSSSKLAKWLDVKNAQGKDLNDGWSFFDDWDLYDRLKDYAKSSTSTLTKGSDNKLNDIGTKEVAEDNASWQYRSILEKIYKPASEGGVDLPGATAARLATYLLEYAQTVSEGMANGTLADAYTASSASGGGDKNTAAFSTYFRTKVESREFDTVAAAKASGWDPYAGLGDYDMLVYFLSFYEYYKVRGYSSLSGLQSCVQLYGFYYQYNQTYYNVVLADRTKYEKQLRYEKLDTYTDAEWLDYVVIQRTNYEKSYRYSESFYRDFYTVHFEFQSRKETYEKVVYVIGDVISNTTYTGEMKKAIDSANKGLEGQLAMSDWLWCYGASETAMKSYNKANTDYQEGKLSKNKEDEYRGQFYYEFEELKIVDYLFTKMSTTELSGALYYNCYGYSGSLISEIQGYEKDKVSITDGIKTYDKFTSVPSNINVSDKDKYAKEKLDVLQDQAEADWRATGVKKKADDAKNQSWNLMAGEIKAAQGYDYDSVRSDDTQKGDWQVRCECLEDRVIARTYSCCGQRVSEAKLENCQTSHGINYDRVTAVTKEYSTDCNISQFVSNYESILFYVATKAQVEFQKPSVGYKSSDTTGKTYTTGYYGNIANLISNASAASDGRVMSYAELKSFTVNMGSSFKEDVADKTDSDDGKWWSENKNGSNKTSFNNTTESETVSGQKKTATYTYTFKGWFLDSACKFEFNPEDDIDFDIIVYAGYDVVKTFN